jgi:hypothetical protein
MARNKNEAVEEVDEVIEDDESEETEETEVRKPITPADIALATGADPKAIRGYLRANYTRPKEMHGKSWDIPADVADAVIEHFRPKDDEEEVDETEMLTELEELESDS